MNHEPKGIPTMSLNTAVLPDGRTVHCVNAYEVDFGAHEIFTDDLAGHGIRLPEDGVFFDVGANIGLFSLLLSDRCPSGRIFAYEPMPDAFAALERNLRERSPNGVAVRIGLGAAPGELEFDHFPALTALSTAHSAVGQELAAGLRKIISGAQNASDVQDILDRTGATDRREEAGFVDHLFRHEKVRARIDTLSNEMSRLGLDRIDLLKIDTEGAEKDVLAGIADADWQRIRQLMVEVHLGADERDRIEAQLQALGYRTSIGAHPLAQGGAPVFHIYARRDEA